MIYFSVLPCYCITTKLIFQIFWKYLEVLSHESQVLYRIVVPCWMKSNPFKLLLKINSIVILMCIIESQTQTTPSNLIAFIWLWFCSVMWTMVFRFKSVELMWYEQQNKIWKWKSVDFNWRVTTDDIVCKALKKGFTDNLIRYVSMWNAKK